jgi:hypothetical protein
MISRRAVALAVLSVASVASWSRQAAAADTPVALDLHYVAPTSKGADGGAGVAGRIGQRFGSKPWVITPELQLAYETFGGSLEPRLYRGLGGLRVGYDIIAVRPGLYVHGGIARSHLDDIAARGLGHTAFTYDVGAFLDFTLLPLVNVGAHFAFNQMLNGNNGRPGFKWLAIGLHAELVL